ncbi:hypothetical protein ACFLTY_03545 [Chloroflexota bacterium]
MVILLAIVLIILGVLVLALRGLFGIFPDNWEWVGIVLAGVGLLMSTPSIIQMAVGKPKIITYYKVNVKDQERQLVVLLQNLPMGKDWKIWRKLGVRRDTVQSLEVNFRVFEAGSNRELQPIIQGKLLDSLDGKLQNRIILPPTYSVGAAIPVVDWDLDKSAAFLMGDYARNPMRLGKGEYRLLMSFMVDGEPVIVNRNFIIGDRADELMWVLPNPNREDYRLV